MSNIYGTLLSSVTVGAGGAASISFSSIPQTPYTDLLLVISARSMKNAVSDGLHMSINGVTTNRSSKWLAGANGSVFSLSDTSDQIGYCSGATATASTFINTLITFPNYAGSTNKTFSVENVREENGTNGSQVLLSGLWSSTAAITSIGLTVNLGSSNIAEFSTAYLYGLTKGSGGATVS